MIPKYNSARRNQVECSVGGSAEILPVDIAAAKAVRAAVVIERKQRVSLIDAGGRILAESAFSRTNVPPFDSSAMDGFAVAAAAFVKPGPWKLRVVDRVVAGEFSFKRIPIGQAARIMTGAPLPDGTDTVIMQEECIREGDIVTVASKPECGHHVRLTGEDVAAGMPLVARGSVISPAKLALLAASGLGQVDVYQKVRIGLISTGSELLEPGDTLTAGKIFNSNRYYLLSRLNRPWIEIVDYGMVRDDALAIRVMVQKAAVDCDVLISTGGVSAGEEDHMLDVLAKENAELEILKVAMRPGKPVTVGRLGGTLYFGLPGNPYAAVVTFEKIGWPAILATGGAHARTPDPIHAICGFDLRRKPGRTEFIPVTWSKVDNYGRPIVQRLGRGSSASLMPLANARGLGILMPDQSVVSRGDELRVELIEQ